MSVIISPCGQGICFPVSFTSSCLEDNVGLAKSRAYFAQFKYSKSSRSKLWKQFFWDGVSDSSSSIYVIFHSR